MTEGQLRFQSLVETKRHNREVEAYNRGQLVIADKQASASLSQALASHRQAGVSERTVALSEEFQPFRIAESVSKTKLNEAQITHLGFENAESVSRMWSTYWNSLMNYIQKGTQGIGKVLFK